MIILIAESKTMHSFEEAIFPKNYLDHRPLYEETAEEIMAAIKEIPLADIAEMTRFSGKLTSSLQKYAYNFSYKSTGMKAIEAFTGVVFKALDYTTLRDDVKLRCTNKVRIISSLYGWLRPDDIVKSYRLDFTSHLDFPPTDGKAMNIFWRQDVTKALVKEVQNQGDNEILLLLPSDAANCIDWKLVKRFAKVWKVDFQEIKEGDNLKTPNAGRLKTLRGTLLRQILMENISNINELLQIVSPHYLCEGTPVYPDHIRFLC